MNDLAISQKVTAFFTAYPKRVFSRHHTMLQAEQELTHIFYLVEGLVSQYDITPTGNEVVVNTFKPSTFFPMSVAINKTPNHYFYEASNEVTVHMVPTQDAVQFIKDNPDVQFDLLSRVYYGVDGVLRRMAHLMGGEAKTRVLFELLNASYRFGEVQEDGTITIALNESDLAKRAGMARETVNRLLQDLKQAGIVRVTHQGFVIKDQRYLEKMLDNQV